MKANRKFSIYMKNKCLSGQLISELHTEVHSVINVPNDSSEPRVFEELSKKLSNNPV